MLKKVILVLLLIFNAVNVWAVPSNQINIPNNFSANTIISSSAANSNNNEIQTKFNTHTHTDLTQVGTITTGTWAASPIAYQYLNLTGKIVDADITASGITGAKLDLTSPGAIGSTVANTGAFSTLKVGTTHQGDVLYDNGTSFIRLTPGTSGQVFQTQGNSANPLWVNALSSVSDYGTSTSASTARQATSIKVAFGNAVSVAGAGSQAITNLPFTSASSYTVIVSAKSSFGTPPAGTDQNAGNLVANMDSGAQFTIYNTDDQTKTVNWVAIGI